jgi:hypothetical protein
VRRAGASRSTGIALNRRLSAASEIELERAESLNANYAVAILATDIAGARTSS